MQSEHIDALIIGAGFSGLYQLHRLRDDLGLKALVVDRATGVGGTWFWNRYPGARCDSESHGYAYFFSEELHKGWSWSERYPGHAEIRAYLGYVAESLDLYRDIRLGCEVLSATYDEDAARWRVKTDAGEILCRYLITAVGCLSTANIPDIDGLGDFGGNWYHTGHWPHEGVDFTGKRVGQIGTGSTGIQAAPVIAEEAAHLSVFQRTPNYSVPARNAPLSDARKAEIADTFHEIRDVVRGTDSGHPFRISETCVFDVNDAARTRVFEEYWETGGLRFRGCFEDLIRSKTANDEASEFLRNKIREIVTDPETAEKLAAIDHPYGAKRPPIDTRYFETFNRDNVDLIDLRAEPIERITQGGIRTGLREYPLDIIVFATGFDALTGPLLKLNLTGSDGRTLRDYWAEGPRTYLGVTIPGFPNLFTVTGPGSPSVLSNMPASIEQHVDWITDCIAHAESTGAQRVEAQEDAAGFWGEHNRDAANATLLPTVKHSWYLGANVPGKPRVFMPYAGGLQRYRRICDEVADAGYPGLRLDSEPAPSFRPLSDAWRIAT